MSVLQTRPARRTAPVRAGAIRACRTCHALYEPPPAPGGRVARVPLNDEDRYCSKACRRAASRGRA